MPKPDTIKKMIGHEVTVDCLDGDRTRGHLVNASRRSLWLVTGDEDRFIPLRAISHLQRAS